MSPLRKIAERLVAATQEAAMLTTFNEVDMSAINLRKEIKIDLLKDTVLARIHVLFTKAATHAPQVPEVNARIEGTSSHPAVL